jgi:hypothetical protein
MGIAPLINSQTELQDFRRPSNLTNERKFQKNLIYKKAISTDNRILVSFHLQPEAQADILYLLISSSNGSLR